MKYTNLGHSGLRVSQLCLGTMTFGREASEADSHVMLDYFVEQGGNFIDTANVYSDGASERIIGNWLKHRNRDDLVIATKVRFSTNRAPNRIGLGRKHILSAIDESLKNLKTDYVDLYQTHCWDERTPLEETLSTLDELIRIGKVRYIGASNMAGYQLQKGLDLQERHGWQKYISLQPLYNLLDRSVEWELAEICRANGLGMIPWSPLRGGWLSGKFTRGMSTPVAGSRISKADAEGWSESWKAYNTDHTWNILDALAGIAGETGHSVAQIALAWLMTRQSVAAPILGVRTLEHLKDNAGATGVTLSRQQIDTLTAISDKPLPYPYDFITGAQKQL